jgi:hypothetical protein
MVGLDGIAIGRLLELWHDMHEGEHYAIQLLM